MIIEGTLTIPNKLKSLGKIREVEHLDAYNSNLEDLGDLEGATSLNVGMTSIKNLGKVKKVKRVYLYGCLKLNSLGEIESVYTLNIMNCPNLNSLGKINKAAYDDYSDKEVLIVTDNKKIAEEAKERNLPYEYVTLYK